MELESSSDEEVAVLHAEDRAGDVVDWSNVAILLLDVTK